MNKQDNLRKQIKLIKAEYDDINYKDFAVYLNININSFYNWLNGYYDLSNAKEIKLKEVIVDLLN